MHEHTNAEKKNRHNCYMTAISECRKQGRDQRISPWLSSLLHMGYGQHLHERHKLNFWCSATNLAKYRLQPKKPKIKQSIKYVRVTHLLLRLTPPLSPSALATCNFLSESSLSPKHQNTNGRPTDQHGVGEIHDGELLALDTKS